MRNQVPRHPHTSYTWTAPTRSLRRYRGRTPYLDQIRSVFTAGHSALALQSTRTHQHEQQQVQLRSRLPPPGQKDSHMAAAHSTLPRHWSLHACALPPPDVTGSGHASLTRPSCARLLGGGVFYGHAALLRARLASMSQWPVANCGIRSSSHSEKRPWS